MRTLLLEDDQPTRKLYKSCIEEQGLEVIECGTIECATNALRTNRIDLLIIDLIIGRSNSLGIARYAGYAAPRAEVIMITGSNLFPKGEALLNFPAISWLLRKPVVIDELSAFVEHAVRRHSIPCVERAS